LFIFLIIIFGFIFMGWIAFGADMASFNTFFDSFSTCWNFIIGNAPDYNAMQSSNRVLGPFFFVLFTIFIFFILVNMFIAILSNSFEVVTQGRKDEKLTKILEEKMEMMLRELASLFGKRRKAKTPAIKEILKKLENPRVLDQPEVTKEDLKRAIGKNATDEEAAVLRSWLEKLHKKEQVIPEPEEPQLDESRSSSTYNTISRSRGVTAGKSSQFPLAELDTNQSLLELRQQVQEMKEMLAQIMRQGSS